MRSESEVDEYKARTHNTLILDCRKCRNTGIECDCVFRWKVDVAAYEASIPEQFWNIRPKSIKYNRGIFKKIIQKYVKKLDTALERGYGLMLLGDNGVGKTMFMCYVLMEAIKEGMTAYYTTMPQLDRDIKRGFKDSEAENRLEWLLTSDFLVIDELGKERAKASNAYMDGQIERIIKQRTDGNQPVLMSTNMSYQEIMESYGPTIISMLTGKFQAVTMEHGDYRERQQDQMKSEMEY